MENTKPVINFRGKATVRLLKNFNKKLKPHNLRITSFMTDGTDYYYLESIRNTFGIKGFFKRIFRFNIDQVLNVSENPYVVMKSAQTVFTQNKE